MTASTRIELEGGGYAVALTDHEGNVEITEYDAEGRPVQRTHGRVGGSGALLVPRRAESDDGIVGDGATEACPRCGSHELHNEDCDGDDPTDPRGWGRWVVCDRCGRKWPAE